MFHPVLYNASSHGYNDGIVRGKHKVLVMAYESGEVPSQAVPPEYADPTKTPLEVDAGDTPFELRVRKP